MAVHVAEPSLALITQFCICAVQFNPEGNSVAVLHHTTNCTTGTSDAITSLDDTLTASVELVTLSVDNNQVWVLPLDGVTSFAYGRWSKLLMSNPQGLYEADVGKHSLQKLKPPATGMLLLWLCKSIHKLSMSFSNCPVLPIFSFWPVYVTWCLELTVRVCSGMYLLLLSCW